ncbi:hypothetical protein COOONC_22297 [Cooperia oncophora]
MSGSFDFGRTGKGKASSSESLGMPVKTPLKRERSQPCPFCKQFMDYKVLIDHMHKCCLTEVGQESTSSVISLDMPVRNYLKRERNQTCPFCKRFMDEKVLIDHMHYCCLREVGEESSNSSNKDLQSLEGRPKYSPQRERIRKCILCNRWMDYKHLVDHMRNFHPAEVKEALGKANLVNDTTSASEKKPDHTSEPNFGDSPISAASLLGESSMSVDCDDEDDDGGATVSEDQSKISSVETPNHANTELGCSSCAKVNERMTQLESTVERLTERLIELEELLLFKKSIKEERE